MPSDLATMRELQWYWDLWQLPEVEEVWRVEFQLRRETLRSFGVETVEDLRAKAPGLWRHLTTRWLSIRLHDSSNTTRREAHPWWDAVQRCAETLGQVMDVPRVEVDSIAIPAEWYVSHVGGCLASFAAREGVETPEAAVELLASRVLVYWTERDWGSEYAKRRIQLNQDPESAGECDAPI